MNFTCNNARVLELPIHGEKEAALQYLRRGLGAWLLMGLGPESGREAAVLVVDWIYCRVYQLGQGSGHRRLYSTNQPISVKIFQ
jgi:hypothetical protein